MALLQSPFLRWAPNRKAAAETRLCILQVRNSTGKPISQKCSTKGQDLGQNLGLQICRREAGAYLMGVLAAGAVSGGCKEAKAKDIPLFGIRKAKKVEEEVVKEVQKLVKEGEAEVNELVKEGEAEVNELVKEGKQEVSAVAREIAADSSSFSPALQAGAVAGAEIVAVAVASSVVSGLVSSSD